MHAAMLCTLLAAGCAHGGKDEGKDGGKTMNVHASLSVEAKHEKVLVTFRIENRGERRVWLPNAIASDEELTGRLFDLREHPGGAEVPYIGPMVKRMAMTAADFFELAPHSAHTHTIDITPSYGFKPGTHTYEIRYQGTILGDVKQLEATTVLETAPVMFSHTAPSAP
jgi:hypothetical protein